MVSSQREEGPKGERGQTERRQTEPLSFLPKPSASTFPSLPAHQVPCAGAGQGSRPRSFYRSKDGGAAGAASSRIPTSYCLASSSQRLPKS